MKETARAFVGEFLSALESREQRLLAWGFYDVTFDVGDALVTLQESAPALQEAWPSQPWRGDMRRLLDDMHYAGLLHCPDPGRYRTRFAETVRLLARLRQMFRDADWASGATLVSDIKLHLTPRLYPKLSESASACWTDLWAEATTAELQEHLFKVLARKRSGEPLDFAAFQRRAFARILAHYGRNGLSGTVVCAGTGAGKTKAFYVPALLGVAADLARTPRPFTKIVAIYPRNVLLADQLREALSEADKLRPVLTAAGLRPLTFGALLGDTPQETGFVRESGGKYRIEGWKSNWRRTSTGFIVPFLRSPVGAEHALVWRDTDREAGRTTLYRDGSQVPDVVDGVLRLTREQLQSSPPDVLFLSLEMLNREMGNPEYWAPFGIQHSAGHAPRLLLLDEVHAYEGLKGAQAAWVLRRWMHWARPRDLHVVGLSATLRDATDHLARVSGIDRAHVAEIAPTREELEAEGIEYNLAVKGDPASGASLLSTSIQCAMLLARTQTPRAAPSTGESPCSGRHFYGSKVFGFSDNLDVLNRWFHDLSDAERQRLARLRQPPAGASSGTLRRRREAGQVWDMPAALDYDLAKSLRVTRCSSQDPGVDTASDVVVATSSLEVGFDDPEVAVTLHHKTPRSTSSFIQRKGRAGRRRGVRPWTVVVLSDYGADRWTFQHAERLFAPQLDAIPLPMANPFVLRAQATYFLLDWLGQRVRHGGPFQYLAGPGRAKAAQERAAALLRDLLVLGPTWQQFKGLLREVLRYPHGRGTEPLSDAALDAILWDPPRSLLTQAIPALLRKLEGQWRVAQPRGGQEDKGTNRPLPQFLPAATFGDLDGADVRIAFAGPQKDEESLPVARAFFETCPGRVSKRYSTARGEVGYWLQVSSQLLTGVHHSPVNALAPEALFLEVVEGVDVYQPTTLTLAPRPDDVLDTSHATWVWQNRLRALGTGRTLPIFGDGAWARAVAVCEVHLHRDQTAIEVLRWAQQCEFEIRRRQADPLVGVFHLCKRDENSEQPEALGFRQRVDGIVVRLHGTPITKVPECPPDLLASLRPAFFQDLVASVLKGRANAFLAERVSQTSLVALTATAILQRCSLEKAQDLLHGRRVAAAQRVLATILPATTSDDNDAEEGKVFQRVLALWNDPAIVAAIEEAERVLWEPPSDAMYDWMRRRHVATLAQALRTAAVMGLTDVTEDDLAVDVVWPAGGEPEVYLTELGPGGLGQIESIARQMRAAPDRFHNAFERALEFCPRGATGALLREVATQAAIPGGWVEQAFADVRAAQGFTALESARDALGQALAQAGITATRTAMVAVMMRLLWAGSSPVSDTYAHMLNRAWRRTSRRLGVVIDARVVAYVCTHSRPILRRLEAFLSHLSGQAVAPAQVNTLAQRLLFGDCADSCRDCLDDPGRFNSLGGRPHRQLTTRWLGVEVAEVDVEILGDPWLSHVRQQLAAARSVRVCAPRPWIARVAEGIQGLLAQEIEVGHLLLPACVTRVDCNARGWQITLRLREAVNV